MVGILRGSGRNSVQKLSSRLSGILTTCPLADFPHCNFDRRLSAAHRATKYIVLSIACVSGRARTLQDERLPRMDWVAPACPVGDFPHGRDKSILQNEGRCVPRSRSSTPGRSS